MAELTFTEERFKEIIEKAGRWGYAGNGSINYNDFIAENNIQAKKKVGRFKCLLCGRDSFTSKQPHICMGGYRARKILWKEIEN
jgi:hypothetical protein